MREKIDCFLPDFDREAMAGTEAQLKACQVVRDIFWTDGMTSRKKFEGKSVKLKIELKFERNEE